jgi:hypothetical protein
MVTDDIDPKAGILAGIVLFLVGLSFYLFPWMIPVFYDMPEGTTLPYYGILFAIEMTSFSRKTKQKQAETLLNVSYED